MANRPQPNALGLSLPDQVRQAAAWVMTKADFVKIIEAKIPAYTKALIEKYPLITALDPQHHFLSQASPAATAAYVLALDSVNFGSGYFPLAKEAGVEFEYNHVAGALKKCFATGRMNTPEKWAACTPADCHEIFGVPQKKNRRLDELMGLFALHLQVSGQRLMAEFGGDVLNLLEHSRNSAVKLAETVAAWPTFRDVTEYKGTEVPMYKRAQILAADLFLAFDGKGPAAFTDMAALTNFPDNMVPHVLRCDGILEYRQDLAVLIASGEYLGPGGAEETEIRAAGLHTVELMKHAAQKAGHNVTSVNLDHILWNKAYEIGPHKQPAHRTLSVWY